MLLSRHVARKAGKMAKPANPSLYAKAKAMVKKRVKKWPSAYASGQLVQQYKRMGGTYKS